MPRHMSYVWISIPGMSSVISPSDVWLADRSEMIDRRGPTPLPFESIEFCDTTNKDRFGTEPTGVDAFELLLELERGLEKTQINKS